MRAARPAVPRPHARSAVRGETQPRTPQARGPRSKRALVPGSGAQPGVPVHTGADSRFLEEKEKSCESWETKGDLNPRAFHAVSALLSPRGTGSGAAHRTHSANRTLTSWPLGPAARVSF